MSTINFTNIAPVIFGITGGLLSLVGLIAIYISINSQQNIQKAKEYLWELQSLSLLSKDYGENSFRRVQWIFQHYKDLTKTNTPLLFVVAIATIVLIFCGVSWWVYLWPEVNLNKPLFYFLVITSVILLLFILMLVMFTQTLIIGNLPKPAKLLTFEFKDINSKGKHTKATDIDIAEIMFSNAKLQLVLADVKEELVTFRIIFPIEMDFKNAKLVLHYVKDSQTEFNKLSEVIDSAYLTEKHEVIGSSMFFVFTNPVLLTVDPEDLQDFHLRLELREEWNIATVGFNPYLRADYRLPETSLNKLLQGEVFYPYNVEHRLNSKEFAAAMPVLTEIRSYVKKSLENYENDRES